MTFYRSTKRRKMPMKRVVHKRWEKYDNETHPDSRIYIQELDKEVIKKMPSNNVTIIEGKTIFDKIARMIKI